MKRLLLKLSGEALGGAEGAGLDTAVIDGLADEIATLAASGVQIGIVIGGGNLFRGADLVAIGVDRVTADHVGMLATVMNALAFRAALDARGVEGVVFSAIAMSSIARPYSAMEARGHLTRGGVALFAGGTGNPFFTTDTAACLRAIEIEADAVLKATMVDGIYTADPKVDPSAKRFDELTYDAVIKNDLKVMDLAAVCMCRDHAMPLIVYDMSAPLALTQIVAGDKVGTRVVLGNSP